MDDVFAYRHGNNLYINLTNRCPNDCDFCVRSGSETFEGNDLWLRREPEAEEVKAAMGDISAYDEIVMCGFGEPTERLSVMLELCEYVKAKGKRVRVNTNGLANLIHGKDITPLFKGRVAAVSVSLNASDAVKYDEICHSKYGEDAYPAILDFALRCKQYVPEVILSVVDVLPEDEISRCAGIAKSLGVSFRVRSFVG